MKSSPLKIGLIGCGHIGRVVHLASLRRLPNVEVTSLADADHAVLKTAHAQSPASAPFHNYCELLEQADTEAVVICLPNALHAEAAKLALKKNKHVYLEKPLAVSLDEGRSILETWRESGRVGMI